jgi:hypothetical protein
MNSSAHTPAALSKGEGRADYAPIKSLLDNRLFEAGVPFAKTREGCLGGPLWVCVALSLDARETWSGGIFENSRCAKLEVKVEKHPLTGWVGGRFVVSCFSGGHKADFPHKPFRKFRAATLEEVGDKIAAWALANLKPSAATP